MTKLNPATVLEKRWCCAEDFLLVEDKLPPVGTGSSLETVMRNSQKYRKLFLFWCSNRCINSLSLSLGFTFCYVQSKHVISSPRGYITSAVRDWCVLRLAIPDNYVMRLKLQSFHFVSSCYKGIPLTTVKTWWDCIYFLDYADNFSI